jgi:LCP family protein required for cell wall assembly
MTAMPPFKRSPRAGSGKRTVSTPPAHRGRPSTADYNRFLGLSAIGALVPGVGLIAAGRRRVGYVVLGGFLLGLVVVVLGLVRAGRSGLIAIGSDAGLLSAIGIGLLAVAAGWLLIALVGFYLLEPGGLPVPQRLLAAGVVVLSASLVVVPLTFASQRAFTHRDLISTVFADEDQPSLTVPQEATKEDPWAGKPRVNVLLLGADSGADREGTRTDTVMVASVDTESGDTALFSLPRNLLYVPFPDGPLREAYPDGFRGDTEAESWLYALYGRIPAEFPDYFKDIADPGAEAVKLAVGEALGLDIDYYVMVNLRGFQAVVTALGGIDIDVPYRIPIGTRTIPGVGCTRATGWIEPGQNQHLDGYHALWFARARCGPGPVNDDYERMRRQRCVIGAIAGQVDPLTLLTRYQQLAAATKDTMSTDIPQQRLDAFAELALKVQEAGIRSLPFTNEIVEYADPDYELIQEFVQESLEPPAEPASTSNTPGSPDPVGSEGSPTETPAPDGSPAPTESATPTESEGAQFISEVC